jgi:hypothetical protein
MVYDTITNMIGGMPGNLIPLQLSQHVGGDTLHPPSISMRYAISRHTIDMP